MSPKIGDLGPSLESLAGSPYETAIDLFNNNESYIQNKFLFSFKHSVCWDDTEMEGSTE